MRSTLRCGTGAIAVALSLALVGCGNSADSALPANAQSTSPPTATASSAAAAAGAESARACVAADAANKAFVSAMAAASDSKGVVPPAEVQKALSTFAAQVKVVSVADAELATALKDWGAGAMALAAEADPVNAEGAAYEKAGARVQALCKAAG